MVMPAYANADPANAPNSAAEPATNKTYTSRSVQPESRPASGLIPRALNSPTDAGVAYTRAKVTNANATRRIIAKPSTNASGTAVPATAAASAPLSAIAAVGAIMATEIPAVSKRPSARRSAPSDARGRDME